MYQRRQKELNVPEEAYLGSGQPSKRQKRKRSKSHAFLSPDTEMSEVVLHQLHREHGIQRRVSALSH